MKSVEKEPDQDEKASAEVLGEPKPVDQEFQPDPQEEQKENLEQVLNPAANPEPVNPPATTPPAPNDEGWADDGDDLDIDLDELDNEADAFGVFEADQ